MVTLISGYPANAVSPKKAIGDQHAKFVKTYRKLVVVVEEVYILTVAVWKSTHQKGHLLGNAQLARTILVGLPCLATQGQIDLGIADGYDGEGYSIGAQNGNQVNGVVHIAILHRKANAAMNEGRAFEPQSSGRMTYLLAHLVDE